MSNAEKLLLCAILLSIQKRQKKFSFSINAECVAFSC